MRSVTEPMRNSTKPAALLVLAGLLAFASSFVFPGLRLGGVPISLASLFALAAVPVALRSYGSIRRRQLLVAMSALLLITSVNAAIYGFEARNVMYLLIPLGAIGSVALMKALVDRFGLPQVQRWALILCGINLVLMVLQAFNTFDINDKLAIVWTAGIDFIAANESERDILLMTLGIRPPGLFPTGIFASTVIYIVCRGVYLYQRRPWPLLVAMIAILLTANRTLAVIFVLYESIAAAHAAGLGRLAARAFLMAGLSVLTVALLSAAGVDLYLLKFLSEEVGSGDLETTASVVERLKTVEIFLENAPRHLLTGGFSSSALADSEHVFDSELMLRTLQFGLVGVGCLAFIALTPRRGSWSRSWNFLFVLAFLSSLTATLTTSVVYAMALAFYKECVVRTEALQTQPLPIERSRRRSRRRKLVIASNKPPAQLLAQES